MNEGLSFKAAHPDHWTLEQAICFLTFGDSDESIAPLPGADAILWVTDQANREREVEIWVALLATALNDRVIQAYGRNLRREHWTPVHPSEGGSLPEPRELITRTATVGSNDEGMYLQCSINIAHRYPGRGIALGLMDPQADRYFNQLTQVYVCVELPINQVCALKRDVEGERANGTGQSSLKRGRGRPNATKDIEAIFIELLAAGKIEAAPSRAAPSVYKVLIQRHGHVATSETVKKRIRGFLKRQNITRGQIILR